MPGGHNLAEHELATSRQSLDTTKPRGNPRKELDNLWLGEPGWARDHTGETALT